VNLDGRGKLYLTDAGKKVSIIRLQHEALAINRNDVLAFGPSLPHQITLMRKMAAMMAGGLFRIRMAADTRPRPSAFRPQVRNGVSNILRADGFADVRVTQPGHEDEPDCALVKLFIAGHFFEETLVRQGRGEHQRQLIELQEIQNLAGSGGLEAGVAFGEEQGRPEAEADGFAVEKLAIAGAGLDGMADGVAEVQQCPQAFGFEFVLRDNRGFDGDIPGDEI
jgi:hypothetical protein